MLNYLCALSNLEINAFNLLYNFITQYPLHYVKQCSKHSECVSKEKTPRSPP